MAQEVTKILSEAVDTPRLSILALQGLGKAHWKGADAVEHVRRERDAW